MTSGNSKPPQGNGTRPSADNATNHPDPGPTDSREITQTIRRWLPEEHAQKIAVVIAGASKSRGLREALWAHGYDPQDPASEDMIARVCLILSSLRR